MTPMLTSDAQRMSTVMLTRLLTVTITPSLWVQNLAMTPCMRKETLGQESRNRSHDCAAHAQRGHYFYTQLLYNFCVLLLSRYTAELLNLHQAWSLGCRLAIPWWLCSAPGCSGRQGRWRYGDGTSTTV